jgi:hypothetical protein
MERARLACLKVTTVDDLLADICWPDARRRRLGGQGC